MSAILEVTSEVTRISSKLNPEAMPIVSGEQYAHLLEEYKKLWEMYQAKEDENAILTINYELIEEENTKLCEVNTELRSENQILSEEVAELKTQLDSPAAPAKSKTPPKTKKAPKKTPVAAADSNPVPYLWSDLPENDDESTARRLEPNPELLKNRSNLVGSFYNLADFILAEYDATGIPTSQDPMRCEHGKFCTGSSCCKSHICGGYAFDEGGSVTFTCSNSAETCQYMHHLCSKNGICEDEACHAMHIRESK